MMTDKNIHINYLPSINYAIWSNGEQCLNLCELTNDSDDDWHDITVRIEGEMLAASECRIDLIPRGSVVAVEHLSITPDSEKLRNLTESCSTQFTLNIKEGEEEVFTHT